MQTCFSTDACLLPSSSGYAEEPQQEASSRKIMSIIVRRTTKTARRTSAIIREASRSVSCVISTARHCCKLTVESTSSSSPRLCSMVLKLSGTWLSGPKSASVLSLIDMHGMIMPTMKSAKKPAVSRNIGTAEPVFGLAATGLLIEPIDPGRSATVGSLIPNVEMVEEMQKRQKAMNPTSRTAFACNTGGLFKSLNKWSISM
mmetsp:Transcript_22924/g.44050  ORF Transcript_22924/g.44050 Transcript_22924/m.44050 type:complete len:202 (+) Transcript_22924:186-791(+)